MQTRGALVGRPQVGDVFRVVFGDYLEIAEIQYTGEILGVNHLPNGGRSFQRKQDVNFDDVQTLQRFLRNFQRPFYQAAAHSTLRADFQGHELLKHRVR